MASEKQLQEIFDTGGFLGQGWSFPPTFSKGTNTVALVKEVEDIKQSLFIILSTTLGERVMLSDFGANLQQQIFEPMDAAFQPYVTSIISDAITNYETRINLDSVDVAAEIEEGRIELTINFTVISSNSRANIVYPYYINEGTNVQQ
ncbi:MAG TPA: GPW/gp25 family protein [Bacteroidia bacterium]|jgi:phage baseplate assembly protein W|nr:GPW/gp25 family protein [Bacteroidia bacterium]